MEKRAFTPANGDSNSRQADLEGMEIYCRNHPEAPSATCRPRLLMRDQLWIALLGSEAEQGFVGIGATVEEALFDFDSKYLAFQHPSEEPKSQTRILPMQ